MVIAKEKAKELLSAQLTEIAQLRQTRHGSFEFDKWRSRTKSVIKNVFGEDSTQLNEFDGISFSMSISWSGMPDSYDQSAYVGGLDLAEAHIGTLAAEIDTFWEDNVLMPQGDDSPAILGLIFERFHHVARHLRCRHAKRPTLAIEDEYDVQDLLHALLRIHFDDIRAEEWTPSYAGGSSRMDFLLKNEKTVVEVKKTNKNLEERKVGDQLLIDIKRYEVHPDCRKLVCFVY